MEDITDHNTLPLKPNRRTTTRRATTALRDWQQVAGSCCGTIWRRHRYLLSAVRRFVTMTIQLIPVSLVCGGGKYSRYKQRMLLLPFHSKLATLLTIVSVTVFVLLLSIYHLTIQLSGEEESNSIDPDSRVPSQDKLVINDNNNGQREYIDRHGVHVIVGQYMGKGFPWDKQPNLTSDILNSNNYQPLLNYGENGVPVYVLDRDKSRAKQLFFINRFNLVASDMISVNRSLPDPRKLSCRRKRFEVDSLPSTSLIVVFHNEAWSTLTRTVHSVINRSPNQLLQEIILVDDASERLFLGEELDNYMAHLSNQSKVAIRILRSVNRIGLIRARILGANSACGKVLTFLDAHCEVTHGWLEPLLYRISINPKAVVCPVIDILNDQTFAYSRSFDAHWGAINWELSFRWYSIGRPELRVMRSRNYDDTNTFRSPIMAGGLFSIDRQYFYDIGIYDSHLNIWGGENIEMSLRIWQCGGRIEISPCSHVGHLFRSSSPYSFGNRQVGDVLYSNLIRVAEVWLDDWKHFFYNLNPTVKRILQVNRTEILANIDERIELRKRLKCKNFEWYLDNIWPEHFFPTDKRQFGQIRSLHNQDCIQRPSTGRNPVGKVILTKCAIELYGPQLFVFTASGKDKDQQIGYIKSDESVCLDVSSSASASQYSAVMLIACSELERQKWRYEPDSGQIIHHKSGLCLTMDKRATFVVVRRCASKGSNTKQKWTIVHKQWKSESGTS